MCRSGTCFPSCRTNAADLTLLTCRGEKLQEGPGSRRQSVYASAPGRGINIRRVMRRDMGRESNFDFVRSQQGDGSRGGAERRRGGESLSPLLREPRVNPSLFFQTPKQLLQRGHNLTLLHIRFAETE